MPSLNGVSQAPFVSSNGYYVGFLSDGTNLVAGDTNGVSDVFISACQHYDCCPGDNVKMSPGLCGCGIADTDSDSDGTPDCNDVCPNYLAKRLPGVCGCGATDTDGDVEYNTTFSSLLVLLHQLF
jgi:hypothetical protein